MRSEAERKISLVQIKSLAVLLGWGVSVHVCSPPKLLIQTEELQRKFLCTQCQ